MIGDEDESPAQRRKRERREEAARLEEERRERIYEHNAEARAQAMEDGYTIDGGEDVLNQMEKTRHPGMVKPNAPLYRQRQHNPITMDEQDLFIQHLGSTACWNQSAYMIGRNPGSLRLLAKQDPFFGVRIKEALQDFRENILSHVIQRATMGVAKPVFSQQLGTEIGVIIEKSDTLLLALIKALDPRFKDGGGVNVNISNNGANSKTGVAIVPGVAATPEEWEASRDALAVQRRSEDTPPRLIKRRDKTT